MSKITQTSIYESRMFTITNEEESLTCSIEVALDHYQGKYNMCSPNEEMVKIEGSSKEMLRLQKELLDFTFDHVKLQFIPQPENPKTPYENAATRQA